MIGLFKGMQATISHLFTRKATAQYPEERPQLPERSRGLIRLRLDKELSPRCISCTFCEQVCPSVAIKIVYDYQQPEKVWTLDAGAGPMLSYFNRGERAVEREPWPEGANGGGSAPEMGGCLAASFISAGELTPMVVAQSALKHGIWLSQAFGVATFYDQLGPGPTEVGAQAPLPDIHGAVEDCPAIVTGGFGVIDPDSIDAYAAAGGYTAMTRTFTEMTPAEVVEEITISGLRGRGGGGRPAGRKWRQTAAAEASQKYIICNGSDGDRGSFKDRAILEHNPHGVIEGMITAGYAVGASEGYICLNAADSTAVARVQRAVAQAGERGLLDEQLPGTDFTFHIRVMPLPEAFVGGEETALINTLQGKRPQPRVRPPWPGEQGLYGCPTLVDNAETIASVPWIIEHGALEFAKVGGANAPGTKLFCLSGAVARPGIYEAPLEISLKKLVEQEAGGFTSTPVAALVGSTGGGFLTPGLFDIPLDFDSLREAGGDLSAGTIEVLGEGDCIVDKVLEGLTHSVSQSCGKCVPDRLGTRRLEEIVTRISRGEAGSEDISLAHDLAEDIAAGSLCGLGRGAVKPLLSALKFFPESFRQHGLEGLCAASKCAIARNDRVTGETG
ncbi:MAG: NADH-ubiquinone oxidoreductase-F iron-sulfur binding region domain-containing protein [Thermoleophilia bacterium]